MMAIDIATHEETWLLLPWLANGRLPVGERARVEQHVSGCALCAREVALQRLMCQALCEPERVTYAPGPSFRKLLQRIDGQAAPHAQPAQPMSRPSRLASPIRRAWRPPGLAWAASWVLAIGLGAVLATGYRWSQPLYVTHSLDERVQPGVLHIAFDRSLPIGAVEDVLRSAGARALSGPDASGVFAVAVAPPGAAAPQSADALRALAARLRTDARVRWVEPLTDP